MNNPRVFIIIPTRERPETLVHSIRTALAQNYGNLEIIVSDNASGPQTHAAVAAFSDPRLRFQRAETVLAMRDSWEFALSAVKGEGFVHIMGDDNGLLPNAVETVLALARDTGTLAITGQAIEYVWPEIGGWMDVPLPRDGILVNARRTLANAFNLRIGWDRLPNINKGFIHTSVIADVRKWAAGRYFAAGIPDVYSAVANAMCLDSYVYLNRPFIVNGASRHSTGYNGGKDGTTSSFMQAALAGGYRFHRDFPPCQSYYLGTYEPFAVAADYSAQHGGVRYRVNKKRLLQKAIYEEYVPMRRDWIGGDIQEFARLHGLKAVLPEIPPQSAAVEPSPQLLTVTARGLRFESALTPLPNVYEASQVAAAVIVPGALPAALLNLSLRARLRAFVVDKILMGGRAIPSPMSNEPKT